MLLNEAQISLSGYVATQPVTRSVPSGATNVSMRVAWTERRRDRVSGEWVDGNTSYVTVICWRKLGANVGVCVRKGDPIVVKGKLSVRTYDDRHGVPRTAVEVEASSVGHDLSRGVASFQRVRPPTGMTASEYAAVPHNGGHPGSQLAPDRSGGRAGAATGMRDGSTDSRELADEDVPLADEPDEPDDAFFDEAAVSAVASDEEPAKAAS
jgi:single-strand DNA-binding protein